MVEYLFYGVGIAAFIMDTSRNAKKFWFSILFVMYLLFTAIRIAP